MLAPCILFLLTLCVIENDTARILAFYPSPSISHQVVFRPLALELIKKGHEVVVFTTDPMFSKEEEPANLTEIDLHHVSYNIWKKQILAATATSQGKKEDFKKQFLFIYGRFINLVEQQLSTDEVQAIINDKTKKFDLLIVEAYIDVALGLSYIVKAPVIQFSSLGSVSNNLATVGAPIHPILYPTMVDQRIYNLTFWEKLSRIRFFYDYECTLKEVDKVADIMLKQLLGPGVPSISELKNNVDMLFLNVHSIWELNRPVPPNVVYLGGLHQKPQKELPKDLKEYLDSSKNGFIYVSFGTNADAALLPPHKLQTLVNVFSKLNYDILWKWNTDELPGKTKNINISKWLPQSDLLRHPKINFFVTQGGLQSTDEAITAGVPLLGIPMMGDQWYNVEQYEYFKVGIHVDMETITEEKLQDAVNEILNNNDSYRRNMVRLRSLLQDQPERPLDRAVWWTEYVLRHGGAKHLRSPAANISWSQYLELELVLYLLTASTLVLVALVLVTFKVYRCIFIKKNGERRQVTSKGKNKIKKG